MALETFGEIESTRVDILIITIHCTGDGELIMAGVVIKTIIRKEGYGRMEIKYIVRNPINYLHASILDNS